MFIFKFPNTFFIKNLRKITFPKRDLYTVSHFSATATFLADSPYIDSCLNLSTMATFFCPQGGRCEEVQLYYERKKNQLN